MTWNANKPADNKSPSLAPAEIRTNWARLQAILTQDHNFTTTTASDQGWHKVVHWINQTGDLGDGTPTPNAGTGQLYTKTVTTKGNVASTAGSSEHVCYQPGTGGASLREASLSACPVRAAVSFQGRTSSGPVTINWGHNIDTVVRDSEGKYTVNFDVDLPSIYYVPQITANRLSSTNPFIGYPEPGTYTDTFKVGSFKVTFSRTTARTFKDPDTACLVFFGG